MHSQYVLHESHPAPQLQDPLPSAMQQYARLASINPLSNGGCIFRIHSRHRRIPGWHTHSPLLAVLTSISSQVFRSCHSTDRKIVPGYKIDGPVKLRSDMFISVNPRHGYSDDLDADTAYHLARSEPMPMFVHDFIHSTNPILEIVTPIFNHISSAAPLPFPELWSLHTLHVHQQTYQADNSCFPPLRQNFPNAGDKADLLSLIAHLRHLAPLWAPHMSFSLVSQVERYLLDSEEWTSSISADQRLDLSNSQWIDVQDPTAFQILAHVLLPFPIMFCTNTDITHIPVPGGLMSLRQYGNCMSFQHNHSVSPADVTSWLHSTRLFCVWNGPQDCYVGYPSKRCGRIVLRCAPNSLPWGRVH